MSDCTKLHEDAMTLTDAAIHCRRQGNRFAAEIYFLVASHKEETAAQMAGDSEPTRSVLYRSAASLALEAGCVERARRLAETGLQGQPPPEIEQELRDVLRNAPYHISYHIPRDTTP